MGFSKDRNPNESFVCSYCKDALEALYDIKAVPDGNGKKCEQCGYRRAIFRIFRGERRKKQI